MELILKPTSRCNFACSFCSAGCLDLFHFLHVTDTLKTLLLKLNPINIILTGGEPLLVSPDFYHELLDLGTWRLSFTTNLKDFVNNPEKWESLFKNPRVGVCTSFLYGESRRWNKDTIYNEDMFREAVALFYSRIGYRLKFISIISEENEDQALRHLELAKDLETKCKLNGLMPLGKSTSFYPLYKMFDIWLKAKAYDLLNYLDYETHLCNGGCNLNVNRMCNSTIRAVLFYDETHYKITACEDDLTEDVASLPESLEYLDPCQEVINVDDFITPECAFCELFYVCNGCHQHRKLNKMTKGHCQEMKKLKLKILNSGWRIQ